MLLLSGTPEQIGRMEGRHDRDAFILLPGAADLRDTLLRAEQIMRRHVPEQTKGR